MTPQKLQKLIDGQSAIAKKVLEAVPQQEAWPVHQIGNMLKSMTRSTVEIDILRGCLRALREAGIIKEPKTGHYQRVAAREHEPAAPVVTVINNTPAAVHVLEIREDRKPTALEALSLISSEMVNLSSEFGARMKQLARQLDDVALTVEEDMAKHAKELEQFQQMKSLLKSIQG